MIDLDSSDLAARLEIPTLDMEHQLTELFQPVIPYGSIPRTHKMFGTYHMYCSDHKFCRLFANPERILFSGCRGCCETNCSTGPGVPLVAALFGIYRKRAVAAIWQSYGIKIAVDLNVDDAVLPYALLGVPPGWSSYAVRKHRHHPIESIYARHQIAVQHSGLPDPTFIVVGGGEVVTTACKDRGWLHVPEHCRLVRIKKWAKQTEGEQPWVRRAECDTAENQAELQAALGECTQ